MSSVTHWATPQSLFPSVTNHSAVWQHSQSLKIVAILAILTNRTFIDLIPIGQLVLSAFRLKDREYFRFVYIYFSWGFSDGGRRRWRWQSTDTHTNTHNTRPIHSKSWRSVYGTNRLNGNTVELLKRWLMMMEANGYGFALTVALTQAAAGPKYVRNYSPSS